MSSRKHGGVIINIKTTNLKNVSSSCFPFFLSCNGHSFVAFCGNKLACCHAITMSIWTVGCWVITLYDLVGGHEVPSIQTSVLC